jgi:hypothetical protein
MRVSETAPNPVLDREAIFFRIVRVHLEFLGGERDGDRHTRIVFVERGPAWLALHCVQGRSGALGIDVLGRGWGGTLPKIVNPATGAIRLHPLVQRPLGRPVMFPQRVDVLRVLRRWLHGWGDQGIRKL